jgi:hypothetical protein
VAELFAAWHCELRCQAANLAMFRAGHTLIVALSLKRDALMIDPRAGSRWHANSPPRRAREGGDPVKVTLNSRPDYSRLRACEKIEIDLFCHGRASEGHDDGIGGNIWVIKFGDDALILLAY